MKKQAKLATSLGQGVWRCDLCPHRCRLAPGDVGDCGTRHNEEGDLFVLTYGQLLASALDPIEKKPLFHFKPGTTTYSVASAGCNLICPFCQNHSISQSPRCRGAGFAQGRQSLPSEVASAAQQSGAASISFTYSEPILMLEFALDVAEHARAAGLDIVYVTNGQATKEALVELRSLVSAVNVDLKCWSEDAYRTVLGGHRNSTLGFIENLYDAGVHVEVTTLVVPDLSDSDEELHGIAKFIAGVSRSIPWHVSRFHGASKWQSRGPTPIEALVRARQIGLGEGLEFVYTGNVPGSEGENTCCPACGAVVVERRGFNVTRIALRDGQCSACGERIAGKGLP